MLSLVMPAATLRCSALPRCGWLASAASLKVCGFTAQTTRSEALQSRAGGGEQ